MSEKKYREFWVTLMENKFKQLIPELVFPHMPNHCVFDKCKEEGKIVHVIEKSALTAKDKQIDELQKKVDELESGLAKFEIWGSDECATCHEGRVTTFVKYKECVDCNGRFGRYVD